MNFMPDNDVYLEVNFYMKIQVNKHNCLINFFIMQLCRKDNYDIPKGVIMVVKLW
jgi:hypothetical protein